jgi:uncharacterized protein involved in exopolysaccharide biosynthesis
MTLKPQAVPPLLAITCLSSLLMLGASASAPAAEKQVAPPPATTAQKLAEVDRHERAIKRLEEEWKKQDQMVREKQSELDRLKLELGISDLELSGRAENSIEPSVLQRLEIARMEASAEWERTQMLYTQLTNLTRVALRQTMSTAVPDPQLTSLFQQLASAEQRLASLVESQSPEHPEIKSVRRVLEQINRQIDDRLDGILKGLKLKTEAENARLQSLRRELDAYKKRDIETAIQRRPYFQAKRDLETLQMVRERLALRIIQEKVDVAIPPIADP